MSDNVYKNLGTRPTDNPRWRDSPKRLIRKLITKAGYNISRIRPSETSLVGQQIPGFFSVSDMETLYLLVATSSAIRILEIGHFLGRSTSVICEAIRDTGRQSVEFNSYDLGFTNAEEFIAHYSRVHDTISSDVPPEYEQLVFSKQTTTTEVAKKHLARFDLARFVNLISGDFSVLDKTLYGFIFCDALHDLGEITVNLPHVIAASDDDCVWAFHDMNPQNVDAILKYEGVRLIKVIETLGIFRFSRAS